MPAKNIIAPNPQGKASIALLNDLQQFNSHESRSKDAPEWLADYFTSLLVLSANFSFKPVLNASYYLYYDNKQWKLSLIEPQAWNNCPYLYFAQCRMHDDNSWSLQPVENWQDNTDLVETIHAMKNEFIDSMKNDEPLIDTLPYFVEHLPYYQRLAAFGLAHSLKNSLQLKLGMHTSQTVSGRTLLESSKENNFLKLTVQN